MEDILLRRFRKTEDHRRGQTLRGAGARFRFGHVRPSSETSKRELGLIGQHHQSDCPSGASDDVEYVGISLAQTCRLGKHDEGVGKDLGSCPS